MLVCGPTDLPLWLKHRSSDSYRRLTSTPLRATAARSWGPRKCPFDFFALAQSLRAALLHAWPEQFFQAHNSIPLRNSRREPLRGYGP